MMTADELVLSQKQLASIASHVDDAERYSLDAPDIGFFRQQKQTDTTSKGPPVYTEALPSLTVQNFLVPPGV
ncbi:hypothetical protein BaRGS_00027166 [Batillaria attramentaria]|uniref:Uncharacterized protein n=1 Tax=Batillaria attramentaria TaxID=370345 RepID=A0ABD0K417_9CAEN